MKKLKTYLCGSVPIWNLHKEYMNENRNPQRTVLVRCESIKKLCEILDTSYNFLHTMGCNKRPELSFLIEKDNTIYFSSGKGKSVDDPEYWVELKV